MGALDQLPPGGPGLNLMPLAQQVCASCALESCYTCENPQDEENACCCGGSFWRPLSNTAGSPEVSLRKEGLGKGTAQPNMMHALQEILEKPVGEKRPVGRPRLADDELSDPVKGGRLRAQREFVIPEGTKCEWSSLAKAGGGVYPVVGCIAGEAKHRHHGPDKSTTNNDPGNVHLVCHHCHNRYHALNDPFYGDRPPDGEPYVPLLPYKQHDPDTKATTDQQFDNEIWWAMDKKKRKTPLPPSITKEEADAIALTTAK